MTTTPTDLLTTRGVLDRLGGTRTVVDGALPPLVLVGVNAALVSPVGRTTALTSALAAAAATAWLVIAVRGVRHESVRGALAGLAGLALAAVFALVSGDARAFFLPAIAVDAAYALAAAGSVAVRRPALGAVYALMTRHPLPWYEDDHLRRIFSVVTLAWALVFAVRAGVQLAFYVLDSPALLASAKIVLGWPLTVLAVVLTLAYLRKVMRG